jgi:hypothetical protein
VGSNISVAGLTENKLPVVGAGNFLEDSLIGKQNGTIIISSDLQVLGNVTVVGNSYVVESNSLVINDRIIGIANNNTEFDLDIGIIMEYPGKNIGIIHHGAAVGPEDPHDYSLTIGYTQNTFTDNHVFNDSNVITVEILGNLITQNNITVQSTTDTATKTAGALVVSGGLGVASNIHSTNVYAASHVGVGTDAATAPIHLLVSGTGETTNGIYVKNATGSGLNDSIVNLEVAASGGDPFITWNQASGSAFAMGLDSSENLLAIANSKSDLTTNQLLHMTTAGITTIENTTNSTSKTTGALIVGGGLGVAGDIHATHANLEDVEADSVNITDTTTSTSTTTGALKVAGGVSTQEKLNVGGVAKIWDSTAVTGKTDGALVVVGGVGISGDIHATHANLEDVEADSVNITDTTTSTSTTTGALKVAGGVSTQEKLNVGGVTKIWDSTAVTGKTDGALVVVGGVGISGDIHATHANLEDVEADSVNITDTTTSTSTTTGALKVAGGVSTQEKLNVGGVTKIWDSTAVTGKTDGALVVVGGVGISGDIHATHANLEDVEADSVNITDTTAATNKTTGALVVAGGVGISGDTFGAAATFDGVTSITNATAATGKTDGALVVTGGVGISGALYGSTADLDGVVNLTDTTEATSSTTGALKAAGGVGIAKDVYVGERAYITGGLVTNTGGVTKKTYSFTGDLDSGQTIANSTIKLTFTAHVFYAKVVAHLVESDDEVSTLSLECGGGHWTGGTPLNVALGPISIFGSASTNPWDSTVTPTTTTIAFKPTTDMAAAGHYNVFIEYMSAHADGAVTKITEGSTDVITFGY